MGNFINAIIRLLGRKSEDEEGERPYPVLSRRRNNGDNYLRKILSNIHKLLCNAFQKMRIIFQITKRPAAEPVLPIKITAPIDEEFHQDISVFSPALEENDSLSDTIVKIDDDDVIISLPPGFTTPPVIARASASAEIIDQYCAVSVIEPQNVHCLRVYENEEGIKEKKVIIENSVSRVVMVDEWRIRWIKHYSSRHTILIVGDGDFSFSACLAVAFGCASNMIATSLDSQKFLENNYRKFMWNIKKLKSRGCKVMHEIDATTMASHELLGHLAFDRIIYNFPFAGFFKGLSREAQLCLHRRLVSEFLRNAKEMLSENGEIHISHKTNNGFLKDWNLESLAFSQGLKLIEAVKFNYLDYPGYNTKYGFGGDKNFNCNPSQTYKFGLQIARF